MRDPCPYCGLPGITYSYLDRWTRIIVRDTKDHACAAWEPKPPLPSGASDTTFIREAWNTQEGLKRWREQLH